MSNYSTIARFEYEGIDSQRYFDILNLDGYDLILGTPFLFQHQIKIGFNDSTVNIGSTDPLPIRGERLGKVSSRLIDVIEEDTEKCRQIVFAHTRSLDLFQNAAEAPFPPLRAIKHTIPIIDKTKVYRFR